MLKSKLLLFLVITAVVLSTAVAPGAAHAAGKTGIMINNLTVPGNTSAEYLNGIIMVPAKEFAEMLGGSFSYNSSSMTGTVRIGENELVFHLDDNVVMFNGRYIQAPAPMKIINYRFMIPARFAGERLGVQGYMSSSRNLYMIFKPIESKIVYQVMSGDSLWTISQLFGTTIDAVKQLNRLTGDMILVGQKLVVSNYIPTVNKISAQATNGATVWSGPDFNAPVTGYLRAWTNVSVIGKNGNWYKVETPVGNGYMYFTVLGISQNMSFSNNKSKFFMNNIPVNTSGNTVTFISHTVRHGDNIWALAERYGIPDFELAEANNISRTAMLSVGQVLKIPVHNIAIKQKSGPQYGEILDWWKEGQYVFPLGKVGKLIDLQTGKSFMIKRTVGANHADVETLTANDTKTMREIFGGSWTWSSRPLILEVDGRRLAVSVAGMPHAGVDGVPFLKDVANRSGSYGFGPNLDAISGNGMDGHFDVHFLNSLRHKDNTLDSAHQYNVLVAGGLR